VRSIPRTGRMGIAAWDKRNRFGRVTVLAVRPSICASEAAVCDRLALGAPSPFSAP
jgi:hypothetical protein